ncbi:MAG: hypothetical protein WC975_12065 [Phycisphaerae bacterium]
MFKARLSVALVGMVCLVSCCLFFGCRGGETSKTIAVGKKVCGDEKSYLRVNLDGQEARQTTVKQAEKCVSNWDIEKPVSGDNLKLCYAITSPDKAGQVTYNHVRIYQEVNGNYSKQPIFIVSGRNKSLLKEKVTYDLGNPPAFLRVQSINGKDIKEVKSLKLVPCMKYKLELTVQASHSETARVYFKTK